MGRSKNPRRRASLDSPPSPTSVAMLSRPNNTQAGHDGSALLNGTMGSSAFYQKGRTPSTITPPGSTPEEINDAINFHWKNLSIELKTFLLKDPSQLSLSKFVQYWTTPSRIENTSPNIAASICGCSWYLALNYMSINKVVEARALILNGCFMQQCYNKPIDEIIQLSNSAQGEHFREELPFFTDGILAIASEDRMSNFLRNKVSSDYQRRMSFATQTKATKNKVADYVNQISSDWDTGRGIGEKQKLERRRRATLDCLPADEFIEIKLVDSKSKEESVMRYGKTFPLKALFKKYAEDNNLSLRELRFSYEGRTLFLSSVGSKSPQDLGIANLDDIVVTNNSATAATAAQEESSSSSSDESKKENAQPKPKSSTSKGAKKKRNKRGRRASWDGPSSPMNEEERLKLIHSRQLGRVFNEASSQFELIRQRLNALTLQRTPTKVKKSRKKLSKVDPLSFPCMNNPSNEGIGGKAGVPFYNVHVGEADNLYKITQPLQGMKSMSIDLHGYTKEEALAELDSKLPQWVDTAQRGGYPFVIPAVIITGGGNQILSEAVDQWIKSNEYIAKAPKNKFRRRRATQ